MIRRFAVMPLPVTVLTACALLAACSGGNKTQQADAPVEVLPGTVSDSMLAEDRLRSEAEIDRTAARTVTGDAKAPTTPDAGEAAADDSGPPTPPPADAGVSPTPTAQGPATQALPVPGN